MLNCKRFSCHRIIPRNFLILFLLLALLSSFTFAASDNAQGANARAKQLIKSMRGPEGPDGQPTALRSARIREKDGDLVSLSAPAGHYFSVGRKVAGDHTATARNFISDNGQAFGVRASAVDFAVKKSRKRNGPISPSRFVA